MVEQQGQEIPVAGEGSVGQRPPDGPERDETWRARDDVDARGMDPMGKPLWWGLGLALVVVCGLLGGLAKVWRVTPDDGGVIYRVSLLDMAQSRMLHRGALEQANKGDLVAAVHAYRGAVFNNPGNPEVLRDWLRLAMESEDGLLGAKGVPLGEAFHLLRVGGTNLADVDLALGLLWKMELPGEMIQLAAGSADRLRPVGAGLLARAYFEGGDMVAFDRLWRRHEAALASDPQASLLREAWKAQWGPATTAREGMDRLVAAQGNPALRRLALELGRKVAVVRGDVAELERLLRLQVEDGTAGPREQVEWWGMLASSGRVDEAREAARKALQHLSCRTEMQALAVAEALLNMGIEEETLRLLQAALAAGLRNPSLVMLQLDVLRGLGRWAELGGMAARLEEDRAVGRDSELVAAALRAVSEAKQGQIDLARKTAGRMEHLMEAEASIMFRLSQWLEDAGLAREALATLRRAEPAMAKDLVYWTQRTMLACKAVDMEDMVVSSRRAVQLAPDNASTRNNHAAALIGSRKDPAEAVRLTFQNIALFPANPGYALNHAFALLANDRVAEARSTLDGLTVRRVTPDLEANLEMAWMELLLREGKRDEARRRLAKVKRSNLLPFQEARLDEIAERL